MASLPSTVYTGSWNNYAKGSVTGPTITISSQQGLFLTAFLAIWITWAGAHLWGIIAFALTQLSSTNKPRDAHHFQRQVLLRNSGGPGGILWNFSKLAWAWRHTSNKPVLRALPTILLAAAHLAAFSVAGIFSSRVTEAGAEVLLAPAPGLCGFPARDEWQFVSSRAIVREAQAYARSCYQADDVQDSDDRENQDRTCRQFSQARIGNHTIRTDARCPFDEAWCLAPGLELDSGYISSDADLGINTKESERLWLRRVTTWVPLIVDGRYEFQSVGNGSSEVVNYDYGQLIYYGGDDGPETFNWTFQVQPQVNFAYAPPYIIAPYTSYLNGRPSSDFIPAPELNRTDADVTIFQIENFVNYTAPVSDPLYRTNDTTTVRGGAYAPLQRIVVLGATSQYQICLTPDQSQCSELTGLYDLTTASLNLTPELAGVSSHMLQLAEQTTISAVTSFLSMQSLITPDFLLFGVGQVSQPLPSNQWQVDSENIHNITLASMQRWAVDWASHSTKNIIPTIGGAQVINSTVAAPDEPMITRLCNAQKIRSYEYASFSSVGVGVIIGLGALIMLVNACLSEIVGWWRHKRNTHLHKRLEWIETETLQQHRMALEGRGIGPWTGKEAAVPVPEHAEVEWSASVTGAKQQEYLKWARTHTNGGYSEVGKDEWEADEKGGRLATA